MGLLLWEKWLPRWLYGPFLCALASIGAFAGREHFSWFHWLACALVFLGGAVFTYAWFVDRRNEIN